MIEALTPPTTTQADQTARLAAIDRDQRAAPAPVFNGFFDRARSEGQGEEAQLREAAEKLVSTTLIMPMFEQLRNDPLASDLFHGGQGEKIFQQQMDQVLSDRIAGATRFDLVDAVYKHLHTAVKSEALNTHG